MDIYLGQIISDGIKIQYFSKILILKPLCTVVLIKKRNITTIKEKLPLKRKESKKSVKGEKLVRYLIHVDKKRVG